MGAPMLGVSGGLLAAETCRAGGLGFLAAGHLTSSLDSEIEILRQHAPNSPLCIGFIGHSTYGGDARGWRAFEEVLQTHRPDVVQFFAPAIARKGGHSTTAATNVDLAHAHGALVMAQVGSAADAAEALESGVDAIIAQGSEAGGHGLRREVGSGTLPLAARIVGLAAPNGIPVLAAGGICDGRTMAGMMSVGCDGVVLGTRLWASNEALGNARFKEKLAKATSGDDVVRTQSFDAIWNSYRSIQWPDPYDSCGALRNDITDKWDTRQRELEKVLDSAAPPAWMEKYKHANEVGDSDMAAVLCGQGVGEVEGIEPTFDIVARINDEAITTITSLPKRVLLNNDDDDNGRS
eukprot:CAMPEP_0198126532 /NCGR_PEP_ID=MMETSP1442-20131203/45019_1 /TAXON_ID= /ORGANISM="Craspedostauros australis, Strain CCMP3328" /LENGTH=349 /DNA_ID=CAMNT_0043786329 /DNA_START=310 /DNA_END=1359 /DNA_ORIENTATION=+